MTMRATEQSKEARPGDPTAEKPAEGNPRGARAADPERQSTRIVPKEQEVEGGQVPIWIALDLIDDHPRNIRLEYDDEQIDAIATQIEERGYESQHAIVVRLKADGRYECDSGHTRMRAARKAGLKKILAITVQLNDDDAYLRLGTENVHSQVTSMEWGIWAAGFELANGQKGCGLKEAAKQIGKSYESLVRLRRGASVFLAHRDHCPRAMSLVHKARHLALLHDLSFELQRYWVERIIAENISRERLCKLIIAELNPEERKSKTPTTKSKDTDTPVVARANNAAQEARAAATLPTSVEATGEGSSLAHGHQPSLTGLSSSAASDPPVSARVDIGDDHCIYPPEQVPGYEWIFHDGLLRGARLVRQSTDITRSSGDEGADGGLKSTNLEDFKIFDPKSISSTAGKLENITTSADLVSLLASVASGPLDQVALVLRQSHAEIRVAIRDTGFQFCESARVTANRARPPFARRPCLVALGEPSAATVKQRVKVVGLACFDAVARALEGPVAVATPDGFRTVSYDELWSDERLGLLYLIVALNDDAVTSAEPLMLAQQA